MVSTEGVGIEASMMLTMHTEGNCNNEQQLILKEKIEQYIIELSIRRNSGVTRMCSSCH